MTVGAVFQDILTAGYQQWCNQGSPRVATLLITSVVTNPHQMSTQSQQMLKWWFQSRQCHNCGPIIIEESHSTCWKVSSREGNCGELCEKEPCPWYFPPQPEIVSRLTFAYSHGYEISPDTGLVSQTQAQSLQWVLPPESALSDTSQGPCLRARTVSCPTFQDNAPWQYNIIIRRQIFSAIFRSWWKKDPKAFLQGALSTKDTLPQTASTEFTHSRYKYVNSTHL